MLTTFKNRLLKEGPKSGILREAFRLQAALHGISMRVSGDNISLTRGPKQMILRCKDIISVPFAVHQWGLFFDTLEGEERNGRRVLDFSRPALHHYRKSGLAFYAPSVAEDDCMDAYTAAYAPKTGDVVWDVGAHAGMSAYFLSRMVGPAGKVYAFEPDDTNYEYLLRNIQIHDLKNVTPVKAALSDKTGTAMFSMDGSMGAGLSTFQVHGETTYNREVETLSLRDACEKVGEVPNYIKADIEGAELAVVETSLDFLKQHPIHLVFESNHMVNGRLTSGPLDTLLNGLGYRAWSSDEFGQRFTWAQPPVVSSN
jgi:FkbM family methyltransferase